MEILEGKEALGMLAKLWQREVVIKKIAYWTEAVEASQAYLVKAREMLLHHKAEAKKVEDKVFTNTARLMALQRELKALE